MSAEQPAAQPLEDVQDLVGQVLGHYRIVAVLNTGGMGAVYRAEHEMIGKRAAVKVLRPEVSRDPDMVRRFFNEARAATAIRHPGIVEVFDFGHHTDGRAYLVMEFLEGQTLSDRLAAKGRLSERDAATIVRGIAGALAAAHDKGIVHRDLKPDNVFLVPDPDMPTGERPKVLDFGIAKLVDGRGLENNSGHTRTGTFMGTPAYMAPEQARGSGDLDHRADLYALGCMFYEMLVGEPPFMADGAGEIIALQLFGELTPPREIIPELSEHVNELIVRLLQKDPALRPGIAAEVVEALHSSIPTLNTRPSALHAVPRVSRAHPKVTTPRPRAATPVPTNMSLAKTTLGESAAQSIAPAASAPSIAPTRRGGALKVVVPLAVIAAAAATFLVVRSIKDEAPAQPAPQPAVAPEPAVAPPTVQPMPPQVVITLDVDPASATLTLDGEPVARDGHVVKLARDGATHQLAVSADGYETRTLEIVADDDQRMSVALSRKGEPTVATPAVKPTKPKAKDGKKGGAKKKGGPGKKGTTSSGSPIETEL